MKQVSSAIASRFRLPWTKSARSHRSPSIPAIATVVEIDPELIEEGIAGADYTLPIFDGTSLDPKDHLIDLDTDSMEKCPDVRVYFWWVGRALRAVNLGNSHPSLELPLDREVRLEWDAQLVREGREWLRESKAKGEGFCISPHRAITANNIPGNDWFRIPAIGITKSLRRGIEAVAAEGTFFDCYKTCCIGDVFLTNIRVPILWTEMLKKGVVPDTKGWNSTVSSLYFVGRHPAHRVCLGSTRFEVVSSLLMNTADPFADFPCDSTRAGIILEEIWPGVSTSDLEEDHEQHQTDPDVIARLAEHTGNIVDFFTGKRIFVKRGF